MHAFTHSNVIYYRVRPILYHLTQQEKSICIFQFVSLFVLYIGVVVFVVVVFSSVDRNSKVPKFKRTLRTRHDTTVTSTIYIKIVVSTSLVKMQKNMVYVLLSEISVNLSIGDLNRVQSNVVNTNRLHLRYILYVCSLLKVVACWTIVKQSTFTHDLCEYYSIYFSFRIASTIICRVLISFKLNCATKFCKCHLLFDISIETSNNKGKQQQHSICGNEFMRVTASQCEQWASYLVIFWGLCARVYAVPSTANYLVTLIKLESLFDKF